MEFSIGVLLGVSTMLLWGISDSLFRTPVKAVGAYQTLFYFRIAMVSCFALFALFVPMPQITVWQVGALALLSVVVIASKYAVLKAVNLGDISVVMPIVNSWGAPGVILATFLLGETVPLIAIPIIAVVLLGVVLLSIQKWDGKKLSKEAPLALFGMVSTALYFTGIAYFAIDLGAIYPTFIIEAIMLVFLVTIHTTTKNRLRIVPKQFGIICASAILLALGTVTYASSARYGVAFIAIPLAAASPLVVVVVARLFFNEKLRPHQVAGVAIGVLGIISLALIRY